MNILKVLLSPLSIIYWMITSIRNIAFDIGLLKQYKSKIPVISVGNLSMGGTGKTPHVSYLTSLLSNYKVAIISRGYGRKRKHLIIADSKIHSTRDIGDEPMELLAKFEGDNFTMVVDGDRVKATKRIEKEHAETQVIILDDGFQHRYVKRNLNLLLTDYNQLFYNDFIIPFGTLREPRKGVKRADAVLITKCRPYIDSKERAKIRTQLSKYSNAPVYFSKISYEGFINEKNKTINYNDSYLVVTGIAKPAPIFEYLKEQSIKFDSITFGDHHNFSTKEIKQITKKSKPYKGIITTEKDWMRLKETKLKELCSVEIFRLQIGIHIMEDKDKLAFEKQINRLLK